MEAHPEHRSELARIRLRKRILLDYSKSGLDVYDLARNILDPRPLEDILDIGCGLGEFLLLLRNSGHVGRLCGVDLSSELIEEARRAAGETGGRIDFRVGDGANIDFPSASFDCVTALHVLSGVDPQKVIQQMGRVVRAEGRVVICANSRNSYPLLAELKHRARQRFGWFLANEWAEGLESESAPEVLRLCFGKVEEFRFEDVLQYPDAEVLVDFFRSTRGLWCEDMTETEWGRIVDWARDQAIELIPEHGYAEDPRLFSLFLCLEPLGL